MGRPREHDQATRIALLKAAERQIADGGAAAVSVRSVAAAAGTSTRAVYALFESKEGLLQALAARAFELLMESVDAVPLTRDPVKDLFNVGNVGFRGFALKHPDLFRLVLGTGLTNFRLGPEAGAAGMSAFMQLVALVDRAHQSGRLGTLDVHQATQQLYATAQGMTALELCGMLDGPAADALWKQMFTTLVAGWASTATAS